MDDPGHKQGLCGAVWVGTDKVEIVTSGADGRLCMRDKAGQVQNEIVRIDNSPINCVAAHQSSQRYATTDDNKAVHVYRYPENQCILGARLQLPGTLLSFNGTGEKLVAGGNDEMLHIIMIRTDTDGKSLKAQVIRKLKAVPRSRGLAFDPEGIFIAAISASGLLQIWEVMDGKQVLSRKHTGPDVSQETDFPLGICWSPDGDDLAVASQSNEVSIFSREKWEYRQTFSGAHTGSVCCLAYSPNGAYLASSGQDNKVIVWVTDKASVLVSKDFEARVISMHWKPDANTLLGMSLAGQVILWEEVIPNGEVMPCEAFEKAAREVVEDAEPSEGIQRSMHADQSEDLEEQSEDLHDRGIDTSEGGNRGEPTEPLDGFDAIMKEAGWGDEDDERIDKAQAEPGRQAKRAQVERPHLQAAIQPGSSTLGENGRRWLAYNLTGAISLKEDEGIAILETIFHDTVANSRRIAPLRDYHSFTMASLGEKGALFAREGNAREEARFMWRPHNPLYPNSDWTSNLALGTRILAVAAGRNFIAIATSERHLHIFTTAGLQLGVRSLQGPVIALAAREHSLAVVWHGGWDIAHADANLEFAVFDVNYKTQTSTGRLPLTNDSKLDWMGFTEEGLLAIWDSQGCLQIKTEEFGGSWVPVVSASVHDMEPEEIWPVAVTKADFFYVVRQLDTPASVLPRPSLSRFPLQPAVLSTSDSQIAGLESEWLRLSSHLSLIRSRQEDENPEEIAESLMADELEEQTNADRILLKLFQDALKTSRLQRAQELAACLHLQRSLQGALKLTNLHRIPVLAERISRLLASREEESIQLEQPVLYSTPQPPPTALHSVAGPLAGLDSSPRTQAASVDEQADVENDENAGQDLDSGTKSLGVASSLAPVANPLIRQKAGPLRELPRNTLFGPDRLDDSAGKRKAGSNPFARRPKAPKQQF